MSAESGSPNPANNGDREGATSRRSSRKNKANRGTLIAVIGAAGVIGAAVIGGIFAIFANSSSSSSTPPTPTNSSVQACSGFRATTDIPSQVESTAVLTIDFNCAPVAGQQYLWVVEAKDIGQNSHSEFYPKQFTSGVRVGTPFNHAIDFTKDKIGEQNCFYVISVNNDEYDAIETNLSASGYTLQLPVGADQVSASACETRVK